MRMRIAGEDGIGMDNLDAVQPREIFDGANSPMTLSTFSKYLPSRFSLVILLNTVPSNSYDDPLLGILCPRPS